jgi:hypothetical protein
MQDVEGDPFKAAVRPGPPDYPRIGPSGRLVAVMKVQFTKRGLSLIRNNTRAIRRHEIHELLITDETTAEPGGRVDRVAGIGFVELNEGGMMAEGDRVEINGRPIGTVVGFDESHMPNHQNIVLRGEFANGVSRGLQLGDAVHVIANPSAG